MLDPPLPCFAYDPIHTPVPLEACKRAHGARRCPSLALCHPRAAAGLPEPLNRASRRLCLLVVAPNPLDASDVLLYSPLCISRGLGWTETPFRRDSGEAEPFPAMAPPPAVLCRQHLPPFCFRPFNLRSTTQIGSVPVSHGIISKEPFCFPKI